MKIVSTVKQVVLSLSFKIDSNQFSREVYCKHVNAEMSFLVLYLESSVQQKQTQEQELCFIKKLSSSRQ